MYTIEAFNTATASTNKIHDDEVAKRFGFRGGLVPGVDVYAYLCHGPVAEWGERWLAGGAMRARFVQPVYDGETVTVERNGDGLELRDPTGALCATAVAAERHDEPVPSLDDWADVAPATDPPPAAPEHLPPGTAFALAPHSFHADKALEYLAAVRATDPVYAERGIAHPGWLLRDANYVLSANVRLGPWIHVESEVRHHGLVHDGDVVGARATVLREWEAKGHRFVTLDVCHTAGDRPVARTTHTAIYRPRGT